MTKRRKLAERALGWRAHRRGANQRGHPQTVRVPLVRSAANS